MRQSIEKGWIGCIYLIRNLVNGKGYVGQTILTFRKRWSLHKSSAKRGEDAPICRAIRRYGWEKFSIEVLEFAPAQQLDDLEKKYIKELSTHVDNGCGYNCDEGGRGNRGFFSKETRAKITAAQLTRWKDNPVLRAQHGEAVKAARAADPGILLRQSKSMKAVHLAHPEMSRKHANDMKKCHAANPKLAREQANRMRGRWQNKERHAEMVAAQKKSYATHPERATKHADYMKDR